MTIGDPSLLTQLLCRCTLPMLSLVSQSSFWPLYRRLTRLQDGTEAEPSGEETLGRLRAIMSHAQDTVPFYRERFAALGIAAAQIRTFDDFRAVPPVDKADLSANFPDRIISSRRHSLPWRYAATSGTIDRLAVVHDLRKRDYGRAMQLAALEATTGFRPGMRYMEIPPDACASVCGVSGMPEEPPLVQYLLNASRRRTLFDQEVISNVRGLFERQIVYRRLELPSFSRDGLTQKDDVLDDYLFRIDKHRPHVLKALPTYLYLLALRLRRTGARPPRITGGLMPMGSSMSPLVKRLVEETFGRPVHEDYGSAELASIASECGLRSGLHAFKEAVYVEVVTSGRLAGCGEVGRVLVTDLCNYAMPLIRYDIGDVAVPSGGACACGRTGDRLAVQGRLQDCLVTDDGALLTPDVVFDAIIEQSGAVGFQLDERPDGQIHLRVVPPSDCPKAVTLAEDTLRELLGPGRRVVTQRASTILPERSGKYRFVRNLTGRPEEVLALGARPSC